MISIIIVAQFILLLIYKLYFFKNVYSAADEVDETVVDGNVGDGGNNTTSDNVTEQIINTTNYTNSTDDTGVGNVTGNDSTLNMLLLF